MTARGVAARLAPELARARLSLELLLGRRALVVAVIDGLLLLYVAVAAFVGSDSGNQAVYLSIVAPLVLLGVPVMGDVVALERRARSLDLVLAGPEGRLYFERRMGALAAAMLLQGGSVLMLARATMEPFPVGPAAVQLVIVVAFLCAAGLFWAVRLRSSGAVVAATLATCAASSPWLLRCPIFGAAREPVGNLEFLATPDFVLPWCQGNAALAIGATLLYLYARRRLDRPATLLS